MPWGTPRFCTGGRRQAMPFSLAGLKKERTSFFPHCLLAGNSLVSTAAREQLTWQRDRRTGSRPQTTGDGSPVAWARPGEHSPSASPAPPRRAPWTPRRASGVTEERGQASAHRSGTKVTHTQVYTWSDNEVHALATTRARQQRCTNRSVSCMFLCAASRVLEIKSEQ